MSLYKYQRRTIQYLHTSSQETKNKQLPLLLDIKPPATKHTIITTSRISAVNTRRESTPRRRNIHGGSREVPSSTQKVAAMLHRHMVRDEPHLHNIGNRANCKRHQLQTGLEILAFANVARFLEVLGHTKHNLDPLSHQPHRCISALAS